MQAKILPAGVILLAVTLVAALWYGATHTDSPDDRASLGPFDAREDFSVFDERPSETALGREEQRLRRLGDGATYSVTYEVRLDDEVKETAGTTIYQHGRALSREDWTSSAAEPRQTFTLFGQVIICGWRSVPNCFDDQERFANGVLDAFNPIPNPVSPARDLERIDHTLLDSFATIEARPTLPPPIESTYTTSVLGEPVTCIRETQGDREDINCYTADGIQLFRSNATRYGHFEEEAIAFSRTATEADFVLPYPLSKATEAQLTP